MKPRRGHWTAVRSAEGASPAVVVDLRGRRAVIADGGDTVRSVAVSELINADGPPCDGVPSAAAVDAVRSELDEMRAGLEARAERARGGAPVYGDGEDARRRWLVRVAATLDGALFEGAGVALLPRPRAEVAAARSALRDAEAEAAACVEAAQALEAGGAPDAVWRARLLDWIAGAEDAGAEDVGRRVAVARGEGRAEAKRATFAALVESGAADAFEVLPLRRVETGAFPASVRQAAAALDVAPPMGVAPERGWLTVDGPSTDDMDDAFRVVDGRIDVAVVHPPMVVSWDGPLSTCAAARGESIYLPDGDVPMLPASVSSGALSLHAGAARPALVVRDLAGAAEVEVAWIQVEHNLTWDDVDGGHLPDGAARDIERALTWAEASRDERLAAGAIIAELPRTRVRLDDDGVVSCVPVARDTAANRLVSELMVRANEAIALWCAARGIAVPFLCQEPVRDPASVVRWSRHPDAVVGALRRMRLASATRTCWACGPHGSLALRAYTRATSPLRRWHDWWVHHAIAAHLRGESLAPETFGRGADAARRARRAMRDAHRVWHLRWMAMQPSAPWTARIVRAASAGATTDAVLEPTLTAVRLRVPRDVVPGDEVSVAITALDAVRLRVEVVVCREASQA